MAYETNYINREAWKSQIAENGARLAWAWGSANTTGQGQVVFEDIIEFGLAFTAKPHFSYGCEVLNRSDFVDDSGNAQVVPTASGCVYEWRKDSRDLYTGAWVAVNVVADGTIRIDHHFTFVGVAIKDLVVNRD